jgi:hypothetical protein
MPSASRFMPRPGCATARPESEMGEKRIAGGRTLRQVQVSVKVVVPYMILSLGKYLGQCGS